MAVLYVFDNLEHSLEEYHRVTDELQPPAEGGLLFHVAVPNERGRVLVIEAFESEEHAKRSFRAVEEAIRRTGVPHPLTTPKRYPIENLLIPAESRA